jgi:hypothetical protein
MAGRWITALKHGVLGSLNYSRAFITFLAENNLPLVVPAAFGLIAALASPFQRMRNAAVTVPRSRILPLTLLLYPPIVGAIFSTGLFSKVVVGRYTAHVLAVYLVIGAWGMGLLRTFIAQQVANPRGAEWGKRVMMVLGGLAMLYGLGTEVKAAAKHGWMVYDIEEMQVTVGRWVKDHTPPSARVALSDIGAITYFSDRRIVDTFGLVTPQVIPFLRQPGKTRDEGLFEYLSTQQPDYLIVFPSWYPDLVTRPNFIPIYSRTVTPNVTLGGDTMVVYQAKWP